MKNFVERLKLNKKRYLKYWQKGGVAPVIIAILLYLIHLILDVIRKVKINTRALGCKGEALCELFDGTKMFVDLTDFGFSADILFYDKREPQTIDYFLSSLNAKDIFFDIGANMGYYTLLAAKKVKQVTAVEPVIENYQLLNKNILKNELRNVTTYNIALAEKTEERNIYIPLKRNWSTIFPPVFPYPPSFYKQLTCQKIAAYSLDEFLNRNPKILPPTWVKMDAEGGEYFIIKGAMGTLKQYKPKILLELHFRRLDNAMLAEILDTLIRLGYHIDQYFFEVSWQWYCAPAWLKKEMRKWLDRFYFHLFKGKPMSLECLKNEELVYSKALTFVQLFLS
ncbi:MAG: FkbM family methyltransferase [Candidatus Omnitrophota bacterium]|nr:FkbM family methyltransferase [Candidatus Omnitrophota bacterium]